MQLDILETIHKSQHNHLYDEKVSKSDIYRSLIQLLHHM